MTSNGGFHRIRAALLATTLGCGVAGAQQIDMSAGTATDQLGQRSRAISLVPSVTFAPSATTSLSLGGSATRYGTSALALGASTAFSSRTPMGDHVAFTMDIATNGARLDADLPATFASAGILPALELSASRMTLYGGGRAAFGYTSMSSRAGLVGPLQATSLTRSATGTVVGLVVNARAQTDGTLRLGARQEQTSVEGRAFTDRSVSLHLDGAGGALDLNVGRRFATDEHMDFAAAGLTLPLTTAVAFQLAAGRYPSNRLMGTAAGNFLSAGVSLRFGGLAHESRSASVPGAPPPAAGYTRLSITAPGAQRVDVAGDFNNWHSVPAVQAGDTWYADLRIPPGQYRYAFRVDGREWRVPHGATAVNDGFGGQSAWLTVKEPGAQ